MTIMKAIKEKGVDKNWSDSLFFWITGVVLLIGLPLLNVLPPEDSWFYISDFSLNRFGKFLAFAILALGLDLIWGYTGILSLGHGVFFGLGAYCIGMHLMLSIGSESVYGSALPDFMVWNQVKELPFFWKPFSSFPVAVLGAIVLGGLGGVTGMSVEMLARTASAPELAYAFRFVFLACALVLSFGMAFLIAMEERPLRGPSAPSQAATAPTAPATPIPAE